MHMSRASIIKKRYVCIQHSIQSILAMQQLRNDYSLTFTPLAIARYSFIQLSGLRRREENENAQIRHGSTEQPRFLYYKLNHSSV